MSSSLMNVQLQTNRVNELARRRQALRVVDTTPNADVFGRRLLRRFGWRILRFTALLAFDIAVVGLALVLDAWVTQSMTVASSSLLWQPLFPVTVTFAVLGQAAAGAYGPVLAKGHRERVALGLVLASVVFLVMGHAYVEARFGVAVTGLFAVLLAGGFWAHRSLLKRALMLLHRRGVGVTKVIVVGSDTWETVKHGMRSVPQDMQMVGYVVRDAWTDPGAMGGVEDLSRIVQDNDAEAVLIPAELEPDEVRQLARQAVGAGAGVVLYPPDLTDIVGHAVHRGANSWPVVQPGVPLRRLLQLFLKRSMDLIGSVVAIALFSPLFVLVAIAIRLESAGPVLFRQKRPGLGGRSFTLYKFRSMRPDAEQLLRSDEPLYQQWLANGCKLPPGKDPRVSSLGRFLRVTSIDELPQLFNVLKGDMSLVGPRPLVGPEIREYGNRAAIFRAVKPGITGWWQINGRSKVGYPERADLDLDYATRWSLWMDMKILFLTLPRLRNGAH